MAAPAAVQPTFRAEPVFYGGNVPGLKADEFYSAAQVITYYQDLKDQGAWDDAVAIRRMRMSFRGPALTWWNQFATSAFSYLDTERLNRDWAYFIQCFRERWGSAQVQEDTLGDITRFRQRRAEPTHVYIERLASELQPMAAFQSSAMQAASTQINPYVAVQPLQAAYQALGPADQAAPLLGALTATDVFQAVRTAAEATCQATIQIAIRHSVYDNVARTAIAQCTNPRMQQFLRKTAPTLHKNLRDLILAVQTEERSYTTPHPTPGGLLCFGRSYSLQTWTL